MPAFDWYACMCQSHEVYSGVESGSLSCSALLTERTGLESKLGRDYGPDDVFLPLDGQCFSSVADKYTYEVCPFGQAAQKEGASSTRCAPAWTC